MSRLKDEEKDPRAQSCSSCKIQPPLPLLQSVRSYRSEFTLCLLCFSSSRSPLKTSSSSPPGAHTPLCASCASLRSSARSSASVLSCFPVKRSSSRSRRRITEEPVKVWRRSVSQREREAHNHPEAPPPPHSAPPPPVSLTPPAVNMWSSEL